MLLFIDDINMPMCFVLQHKNRKSQQEWPSENKQDAWNIMDYHCVTFVIKVLLDFIIKTFSLFLIFIYFHLENGAFLFKFSPYQGLGQKPQQGCYFFPWLTFSTSPWIYILVEFPGFFFFGGGGKNGKIGMSPFHEASRSIHPGSLVQKIRLRKPKRRDPLVHQEYVPFLP